MTKLEQGHYQLSADQIQKYLPHRVPFLLIDRVLKIVPQGDLHDTSPKGKEGTVVVALKNLSFNESFFQGHFPGFAIYPGVLLLESMAQTASMSLYPYFEAVGLEKAKNFRCILVGANEVRFRKALHPGDTIILESVVTRSRGLLWTFQVTATVEDKKVGEAEIMANMIGDAS